MNPTININNRKKLIIIGGLVLLCVVVAVGVYYSLRTVAPRDSDSLTEQTPGTSVPLSSSDKERIVREADTALQAGGEALKVGKADEAITHLTTAKTLYEQAGESAKAEQTTDVIDFAEHQAEVEAETEEGQGEEGGTGGGEEEPQGPVPGDPSTSGDKATTES